MSSRTASQCSCGVLVGHDECAAAFECPGCLTYHWVSGMDYSSAVFYVNCKMRGKPMKPKWVSSPTRKFIAADFHCEDKAYPSGR